jgi:hypothetical protein
MSNFFFVLCSQYFEKKYLSMISTFCFCVVFALHTYAHVHMCMYTKVLTCDNEIIKGVFYLKSFTS